LTSLPLTLDKAGKRYTINSFKKLHLQRGEFNIVIVFKFVIDSSFAKLKSEFM